MHRLAQIVARGCEEERFRLVRSVELARALGDAALEAGVKVFELRRHAVELPGELLQLVAGFHADAMPEVSLAYSSRAEAQRADWRNHATHEHQARGERERQSQEKQEACPPHGGIHGHQSLLAWLL